MNQRVRTTVGGLVIAVAVCAGTLIAHAATADDLAAERAYRAGADLDHRGDCAGAQAQYAVALALLEKIRAAGNDPRMMSTLFNLAFAEHCTGAERAAYDHLNRVLVDLERAPRAVVPANQLILAYDLLGKITHELALWNEEIAALARAASVFATDPGQDPLDLIDIELRRSVALMRVGQVEEGRRLRSEILSRAESSPALAAQIGPVPPFVRDKRLRHWHLRPLSIRICATATTDVGLVAACTMLRPRSRMQSRYG